MPTSQSVATGAREGVVQVLGVDTCGPTGSVALGLWVDGNFELLGQKELAGRSYSSTLITAVGELLSEAGTRLDLMDALVVVNGPGSFTGVRVGLSAVKGLAEPRRIPVVAVSRLAVMTAKAETSMAALDAHRNEIFLRTGGLDGKPLECLAGVEELSAMPTPRGAIAICDDAAGTLLSRVWPEANLMRILNPTAGDAIELCLPRIRAREFDDLALLDGHYLRRSDAEIFGDPATARVRPG